MIQLISSRVNLRKLLQTETSLFKTSFYIVQLAFYTIYLSIFYKMHIQRDVKHVMYKKNERLYGNWNDIKRKSIKLKRCVNIALKEFNVRISLTTVRIYIIVYFFVFYLLILQWHRNSHPELCIFEVLTPVSDIKHAQLTNDIPYCKYRSLDKGIC